MHSGCLESRKGLKEKALSLDRFEFASKKLKIKQDKSKFTHVNSRKR